MSGIFRLIRWRTIVFAAFSMYVMRYFVVRSILDINGFTLQMTDFAFSLLVISVCCFIAGTNIINDYFDNRADRISGVRDVIVGRTISRRTAISLHTILNVTAVLIGFYLSFAVGIWKMGIFFVLASGLLWFYSSSYKRYFIIGNFIVAFLMALIPLSVVLFEIPLLNMVYADLLLATDTNFMYLFNWGMGFAIFAFLNTWMYEINKDLYTVKGDRADGIHTIPVRSGEQVARYIILSFAMIAVIFLVILCLTVFRESSLLLGYVSAGLILPYLIYMISVMGNFKGRVFQLRLIRLISVLCVCLGFLLHYFFELIFQSDRII